jgi:uncharacterized membrane protein
MFMRAAEAKLAEWHRLYLELAQAQSALVERVLGTTQEAEELRSRIATLQRESDLALQALHDAVAAAKQQRAGGT